MFFKKRSLAAPEGENMFEQQHTCGLTAAEADALTRQLGADAPVISFYATFNVAAKEKKESCLACLREQKAGLAAEAAELEQEVAA